ncbi:hypothetical protein ACA910_002841 [Epithemia clementina (nom. ined.)]
MRAPVMHTPAPASSSTPLVATASTKKRQRDSSLVRRKVQKNAYQIVPGKHCRLQPYVVHLLEEVLSKNTTDVLNYPLPPDLPHTEPESRRQMREHLKKRFLPTNENTDLVRYTEKLLELWGAGKLHFPMKTSCSGSSGKRDILKLITPLRRPRDTPSNERLDALGGDLFQLDFLEEGSKFNESVGNATSTMEDNWNSGRTNLRRVTYHETPSAQVNSSMKEAPVKVETESKAKKAKVSNPKRGMRWTTAERKLFLQGLERWGAGNWKSIHKIIPGRTYVQVKSMGVYLVSKFHMSRGQGPSKAVTDYLMASTTS